MIGGLHDDARARGEIAAVLTTSESTIYGRYGYGPATWRLGHVDRSRRRSASRDRSTMPAASVWSRAAKPTCSSSRSTTDAPRRARGWSRVPISGGPRCSGTSPSPVTRCSRPCTKTSTGAPTATSPTRSPANGTAVSPTANCSCGISRPRPRRHAPRSGNSCSASISSSRSSRRHLPVDEPLRFLLADSRKLRTDFLIDSVWVLPLDAAAFLGARTYSTAGKLVIEIVDHDGSRRRVALDGGPDGASASRRRTPFPTCRAPRHARRLSLGGTSWATYAAAAAVERAHAGCTRPRRRDVRDVTRPATISWF